MDEGQSHLRSMHGKFQSLLKAVISFSVEMDEHKTCYMGHLLKLMLLPPL